MTTKAYDVYVVVKDFIQKEKITCAEKIFQSDNLYSLCPELVEQLCEIIGYYDED